MLAYLDISADVAAALAAGKPVVALESTIISHGLPWPANRDLAFELEGQARQQGVTPATIAVLNGRLTVGLSKEQISHVAELGRHCLKLSSYDIPWAIATKSTGATTVAGTMHAAAAAGIKVFATGGIGGVHRDAHLLPDTSHDLDYLSQVSMVVVSAGAKTILDLPATVEYLETKGVLVLGYRCQEFPAFYYRDSGIALPYTANEPEEVAQVFRYVTRGSLLVANPVPAAAALPKAEIESCITIAVAKAREQGVVGKELTPFLLAALDQATGGRSVACNRELIRNNLKLACQIASVMQSDDPVV